LHAKIIPVKMNRGQSIIQISAADTVVPEHSLPEGREDAFIGSDALKDQLMFTNRKAEHEKLDMMMQEISLLKNKLNGV